MPEPQPPWFHGADRPAEGMGIWRNRVHPEEMCSSGKRACRSKGHLCFSPASGIPAACLRVNQPSSSLGICTVQMSLVGVSSAPAVQA